jgi:hypothetical protein
VTLPVPIRQDLPLWTPTAANGERFEGELEVVIDTAGAVQAATIAVPIQPTYDRIILEAARKWTYRPAMKDGRPVSYCKAITIALAPQ